MGLQNVEHGRYQVRNTLRIRDDAIKPLSFKRIGATWRGDKVSNTEARQLLCELREWVNQYQHEDALAFKDAVGDLERLFTCVWTEIDESLSLLNRMRKPTDTDDQDRLATAMSYLHRWQDRGGRIGNASPI